MKKKCFLKSKLNLRAGGGAPVLEGLAFDYEVSEDGVYGKECFARDIKINYPSKCFLLRDHDKGKVLARLGRNLKIDKNKEGLHFEVSKLPKTPLSEETRELVKEGIIGDVSIGFIDNKSEVKNDIRTFKEITLHELSILPWGYHEGAQVTARENKEKIYYPPEVLL